MGYRQAQSPTYNCINDRREIDPVNWGGEVNPYYCTGLIKGYFCGEPPIEFFTMFSYYLAYDALAALCDTSEHNQGEPEEGWRHMRNIFLWFDNMTKTLPSWYMEEDTNNA